MAEGVVDALEVVDVDHRHRQRAAAPPRGGKRGVEVLVEPAAVGAAGQRVGARQRRQPFGFEPLHLRIVLRAFQVEPHLQRVQRAGRSLVEQPPVGGVEGLVVVQRLRELAAQLVQPRQGQVRRRHMPAAAVLHQRQHRLHVLQRRVQVAQRLPGLAALQQRLRPHVGRAVGAQQVQHPRCRGQRVVHAAEQAQRFDHVRQRPGGQRRRADGLAQHHGLLQVLHGLVGAAQVLAGDAHVAQRTGFQRLLARVGVGLACLAVVFEAPGVVAAARAHHADAEQRVGQAACVAELARQRRRLAGPRQRFGQIVHLFVRGAQRPRQVHAQQRVARRQRGQARVQLDQRGAVLAGQRQRVAAHLGHRGVLLGRGAVAGGCQRLAREPGGFGRRLVVQALGRGEQRGVVVARGCRRGCRRVAHMNRCSPAFSPPRIT